MSPRRWAGALLPLAAGALLALAACSTKKTLVPDVPPETGVFVKGELDTVNHIVQLFWFGNDADGMVVGFELRFVNPAAPADTDWVFTTRTDSIFTVYTPGGFTAPRFEVRAIDDAGQHDPSPAIADFSFTNLPAVVTITGAPAARDSVYATATIDWSTVDPDGIVNRISYRVWLDGNEANARIVTDRTYSIPPADFIDGGQVRAGTRYFVVQPIDDGGLVGTADTATFFVRDAAGARLLVIDDVPSSQQLNYTTDQLYYEAAQRALGPGPPAPGSAWSLLLLEFNRPFRSITDLEQTLSQFDAVIWYRGDLPAAPLGPASPLRDYQDALVSYVESGGHLLVEGRGLFQSTDVAGTTTGSLRPDLAPRLFGGDLVRREIQGRPGDSTTVFGINNGRSLKTSMWSDSLRFQAARDGLFCFHYGDTNQVAFWAPPGELASGHPGNPPEHLAVGKSVPHPGGGRAIVLAFPLRVGNGFTAPPNPSVGTVPRILDRIFAQLLGP